MATEILKTLVTQVPMAAVFAYISWQLYQDWKKDRAEASAERKAMGVHLERLNKSYEDIAIALANLSTIVKRSQRDQGF